MIPPAARNEYQTASRVYSPGILVYLRARFSARPVETSRWEANDTRAHSVLTLRMTPDDSVYREAVAGTVAQLRATKG